MDLTEQHYFGFSTNWRAHKRLCRDCGLTYDEGNHREVTTLEPRTNYVCPSGGGFGHSGIYTGAYDVPELRRPNDHICICGQEFIAEDGETWRLTFETQTPLAPAWHPVSVVRSKHAAHQQHKGLLALIAQGEPIRNVELTRLVAAASEGA